MLKLAINAGEIISFRRMYLNNTEKRELGNNHLKLVVPDMLLELFPFVVP